MSTQMISKEAIDEWLGVGSFAPSGDNIQPWLIKIPEENTIILEIDQSLDHLLDITKNASLLSLGCFFECLSQSAEHFGIKIESSLVKESSIILTIGPVLKKDHSIVVDKIKSRVTDRGNYEKIVDHDFVNSLLAKEDDVTFCQNLPVNVFTNWSDLEYSVWKNTSLMNDFLKWIRLTKIKNTSYGLSVFSLGIGFAEILSLYFLKLLYFCGFSLQLFILKPVFTKRIGSINLNSSGYVIFWLSKLDVEEVLNIGRKVQRVWMELNYNNISAQPMAIQSLFISDLAISYEVLKSSIPPICCQVADETLQSMQQLKANPSASLPGFMLRVGKTRKKVEPHARKSLVITR